MGYTSGCTLGLVETLALVPAIEAADKMLKAAEVELIALEAGGSTLCTVFVTGDISACTVAVKAGVDAAQLIGKVTTKNVMPRPIQAISAIVNAHLLGDSTHEKLPWEAIGLVETFGVIFLMEAADAMCKTANVELIGYENIYDGYVSVLVGGNTSACETAVAAGVKAVRALGGEPYSSVVIAAPHPELKKIIERYSIDGWECI